MPTTKISVLSIVAAALLLAGASPAQQTPAASSPSTPPAAAKPAPAAKSTQTPTAKTGAAATKTAPAPLTLSTQTQKISYALGMGLGKNLKRDSVEVDPAVVLRGLKDALAGNKLLLTDDEAKAAITQLNTELRAKAEAKAKAAALENKMKADAFLADNKTKEGVVTLPSGLQYKILSAGTGPKPKADDTVSFQYRGTLTDGTEFDSSYKRGQPLKFPVAQLIKGWTEALQLMPVGSKWQLFIPPDLGYGERGVPNSPIGPNSALVFELELISIEPKEAPKETPKPQTGQKDQAQPTQPSKDQPNEAPKEQPKAQPKDQAPAPTPPKP
jgi:FKBP-type peptidyl-prolyl cis-trans isomerase FklB